MSYKSEITSTMSTISTLLILLKEARFELFQWRYQKWISPLLIVVSPLVAISIGHCQGGVEVFILRQRYYITHTRIQEYLHRFYPNFVNEKVVVEVVEIVEVIFLYSLEDNCIQNPNKEIISMWASVYETNLTEFII